jgi:hypothetical protein
VVAVLALAAAGTAIVLVARLNDSPDSSASDTAGQARPDTRPAERNVLSQRIEEGPVTYGATPAFDACAVLPRAGLADLGFPENTTDYRDAAYLPASVAPDQATLRKVSDFDPLSECGYTIRTEEHDDAYVVLDIAQSPFNTLWMRGASDPNSTRSTSSGLDVATRQTDDQYFATIGDADSTFVANVVMGRITTDADGVPATTVFAKLVDVVAAGLAEGPTARSSYAFTGAYGGLPFACDVLTSTLFTDLTGEPDSGRVEVRDTPAHETDRDYPGLGQRQAVEQQCTRSSTDRFATDDDGARTLTVSFKTFRDEDQAASAHAFDCDPENPAGAVIGAPVPVNEEIGDAPPCVRPIGHLNYLFLVGRTAVRVKPNEKWAGTEADTFGREFAPLATTLAEEVRERF